MFITCTYIMYIARLYKFAYITQVYKYTYITHVYKYTYITHVYKNTYITRLQIHICHTCINMQIKHRYTRMSHAQYKCMSHDKCMLMYVVQIHVCVKCKTILTCDEYKTMNVSCRCVIRCKTVRTMSPTVE